MDDYYSDTACFTGHRRIPPDTVPEVQEQLREAVKAAWDQGYRRFLCGGALGFDTLAALAVLSLREMHREIQLVLVLPCADQARYWSEKDRQARASILQAADLVVTLQEHYDPGCMHRRNLYLVDHASLCICLLTQLSGGTLNTVRYAVRKDLRIWNLAIPAEERESSTLREDVWNYTFTSPSVSANADTATFRLMLPGKTAWKDISARFLKKHR
jgi:uncharacterized phage-like protein YoqJ